MPKNKQIVESFVSSSPKVLIINEIGAIGSHLVDTLLSLGCQVSYFGDKKNDEISHLLGKNNFEFYDRFNKLQKQALINYVFYLTNKEGKYLEKITKMIRDKKAKFLLAFPGTEEASKKLIEQFLALGIDARICFYQEFYGPRINEGIFSSIIKKSVFGEKIKIPGEQTEGTGLVFYSDFVRGLNRAIFAPETTGKILNISGEQVSFLSFLGKLEKEIKEFPPVEFLKEEGKITLEKNLSLEKNEFGWQPEVGLEEGVIKTISWWERKKEELLFAQKKKIKIAPFFKTPQFKRPKLFFGLSIFILLTSLLFLCPLFILILNLTLAKSNLLKAEKEWKKDNLSVLRVHLKKATSALKRGRKTIELTNPFYSLIGLAGGIERIETPLEIGANVLDSAESLFACGDLFLPFSSSLIKGERVNFTNIEGEINYLLEKSYLTASMAWGSLEGKTLDKKVGGFFGFNGYLTKAQEFLPEYRRKISQARMILPLIPELIGQKGKRTYLVLLQDNFELRPTGGYLGSLVLLSFDQGQLLNFEVQDVSQLDSQLRGQVSPPQKIKDYLGVENWYLHDANWFPDFPTSGVKTEWFLTEETGRTVDGVVGFNIFGVQEILKVLGEVNLPKIKEKINAQNIEEKIVYTPYQSSFPGSTQNLDVFGQVVEAIYEKIKVDASVQNSLIRVAKAVYSSLEKKDLLVFLHQEEAGKLFKTFNWDGAVIVTAECQKVIDNCFEDYLFLNEANLGFNKANYFIKRMINQSVSINEKGEVLNTLKIFYQNMSLSEVKPQGRYKTYLRVHLPSSSLVETVMINDPEDSTFWVQIPLKNIDSNFENGRLNLGFLMEVPVKSKRIVEIKYSNQTIIDLKKRFSYLLLNQKQSGLGETPYTFSLSYPATVKPLKILPKGVLSAGKILINENLDKDKIFRIDFGR